MLTKSRLREKVATSSKRLSAAANIHRLSILYLLGDGPMDVREIVWHTGLAANLVSHHLKQLFTTGWVKREKRGTKVSYQLEVKTFFELERLFSDTPFGRDELEKKHND